MSSQAPSAVSSTRILIVDHQALVRAGVRALLEKIGGMEVVAETGDGHEVINLTRQYQPQIVLLDISLPDVNAFELMTNLGQTFPAVRIVVVTTHDGEERAAQAFRAGAVGYLPKSAAGSELALAIEAARRGEKYFAKRLPRIDLFAEPSPEAQRPGLSDLTPRQQQVLKLIAEGSSTREIAHSLEISVKTAESHRTQLMERLNIHDIAGLVRYAIRTGLVAIEGYEPEV
jgi:DNA-binding NarL/FixJ family response regulator